MLWKYATTNDAQALRHQSGYKYTFKILQKQKANSKHKTLTFMCEMKLQ